MSNFNQQSTQKVSKAFSKMIEESQNSVEAIQEHGISAFKSLSSAFEEAQAEGRQILENLAGYASDSYELFLGLSKSMVPSSEPSNGKHKPDVKDGIEKLFVQNKALYQEIVQGAVKAQERQIALIKGFVEPTTAILEEGQKLFASATEYGEVLLEASQELYRSSVPQNLIEKQSVAVRA